MGSGLGNTNNSSITASFNEVEKLVSDGICCIPTNSGKVPLIKWSNLEKPFDILTFWDLVDKTNASGVAIRTGLISGNVICLDVDTKHKPGFDAVLFLTLREIYPNLWEKLRVERTPSGGYHLLYRLASKDSVASCNFISRYCTNEELLIDPGTKTVCFVELKAEKMLCQSFPSKGYERIQGGSNLEVFTFEEHSSLLALVKSYDEVIKAETSDKIKGTSALNDYYEAGWNPFQHFDSTFEAESILEDYGWKFLKKSGRYNYYQKPNHKGGSANDVHASFNIEKRLYKVFTSNAGTGTLEPKAYSPARLLCQLMFNGDYKQLSAHLVKEGYGRIKTKIEERIVKNRAQYGGELPSNISQEGRQKFEQEKSILGEKYPYGIFWEVDEKENLSINRERLYIVSDCLGFRIYNNDVCYIHDNYIVERVEVRKYFDLLKQYINEEESVAEEIKNCYESFLQKSGSFTISRLRELDTSMLLKSTKDIAYKAYQNGYCVISLEGGIEFVSYEGLDKLIWKHQIQERDFTVPNVDVSEVLSAEVVKQSLVYRFYEKATGIHDHLFRCLGYYAHDYKSTMTSYIVVLSEQCEDAKKGGGSGKNVFTNLLQYTTSLLNKPGKNVKFDDTLLRTWKGQRILSLNDLDKKFDFLGLKELSSGEGEVGKKFVQEVTISNNDMPKFICNTNFSFDPSQPGLKRRLIALEFTQFFTLQGGVDAYFGKDFPGDKASSHDWTEQDWIGFDWILMYSIWSFIKNGCKLVQPALTDGGWVKQFEQRFGKPTLLFIRENILEWLSLVDVKINETFNIQYENFCKENNIGKEYRLSSIKMNEALEEYCDKKSIEFIKHKNLGKVNYVQCNAKVFIKKPNFKESDLHFEHAMIASEEAAPESEKEEMPF